MNVIQEEVTTVVVPIVSLGMMVMVNTRLWKSAIANVAQHVSATRRGCVILIEGDVAWC